MNSNHSLILASNSPRRQQLLKELGYNFEVRTQDVNEDYDATLAPMDVAKFIAEKKADAFKLSSENEVVITADTIVLVDDNILGKPASREEAKSMLQLLSGRSHDVITGVCIKSHSQLVLFDDCTEVTFRSLLDYEIEHYIDTCKPFDKAGAYGIQEWIGMIGITHIKGSYFNVVGLPVHKVNEYLNAF